MRDAAAKPPAPPPRLRLQRKCSCGGTCETCRKKKKPELQRRPLAEQRSLATAPSQAPPIVHQVLRSAGEPLDTRTRGEMEKRFGQDLRRVRIHRGPRAAASAAAVEAEAYTVGRHIAFGPGRYDPASRAGRELLAHELGHTLQQGQAEAVPRRLEIGEPGGPDERQAEGLARRVLDGAGPSAPGSASPPRLQRKALATVHQKTKPKAKACLVHVHADEKNALFTATTLHRERCANLVFVETKGSASREVTFEAKVKGEDYRAAADPNRIFTDTGVKVQVRRCVKQAESQVPRKNKGRKKADRIKVDAAFRSTAQTVFEGEIQAFRNDFSKKISSCRGGSGSTDLSGEHPVVAFHNNFDDAEAKKPGLNIGSFRGSASAAAVKGNPSILKRDRKNELTDRDNFLLVTKASDFAALKGDFNIVQQATGLKGATKTVKKKGEKKKVPDTARDDGSLSVALEGERYLNIESEGRRGKAFRIVNLDMGNRVLDVLKVPKEPCAETAAAAGVGGGIPALVARLIQQWIVREQTRVAAQKATLPKALPRDKTLPAAVRKLVKARRCQTFADQAALDTAKAAHAARMVKMKTDKVVRWILGLDRPPKWVTKEVGRQTACLEAALKAAAKVKGSGISSPKKLIGSRHRSFRDQRKIWNEKFTFTRGGEWGRITGEARKKCPGLVQPHEVEWNSKDRAHKDCFLNLLTDEERQREILQTSSAPGISRHHFGTEFDFVNDSPADWEAGKTGRKGFADELSWMRKNASTYGFFQPFTADSTFLRLGYIEERWHWSYYPIADALLEWAKSHRKEIGKALTKSDWAKHPDRFSFLQGNDIWTEFMFNVKDKPEF